MIMHCRLINLLRMDMQLPFSSRDFVFLADVSVASDAIIAPFATHISCCHHNEGHSWLCFSNYSPNSVLIWQVSRSRYKIILCDKFGLLRILLFEHVLLHRANIILCDFFRSLLFQVEHKGQCSCIC